MQLYLIRHAESENNAKPERLRVEDPPISSLGRQQAKCLGQWVRTLSVDILITSPFLRTLETTREVVNGATHHVHVWHDLFEQGGCYRGHGPDAPHVYTYSAHPVSAAAGVANLDLHTRRIDWRSGVVDRESTRNGRRSRSAGCAGDPPLRLHLWHQR